MRRLGAILSEEKSSVLGRLAPMVFCSHFILFEGLVKTTRHFCRKALKDKMP